MKITNFVYGALVSLFLTFNAIAVPQCLPPTTACVDSTPCKSINGTTACLSTAVLPTGATRLSKSCWDTQNSYVCDLLQIDTCKPLLTQGCTQSNSVCKTFDASGNCALYTNTFDCPTLVTGQNTTCNGIPASCVLQSSNCITTSAAGTTLAGQCTATSKIYDCPNPSTTSTTVTDCSGQTYCQGTQCTPAASKPNLDFNKVVSMMETARQAGNYFDPSTAKVFDGHDKRCTVQLGVIGLIGGDCCKITGGAQNNNQMVEAMLGKGMQAGLAAAGIEITNPSAAGSLLDQAVSVGSSAVGTYATNAFNSASTYVYDNFFPTGVKTVADSMVGGVSSLFGASNVTSAAASAAAAPIASGAAGAATTGMTSLFGSFSFSFYGLTMSTAPLAAGSSSIGLGGFGGMNFSFNPWAFAAAVAIQIIMEAIACSDDEKNLMQIRGANLCHLTGSYCSNKIDLFFFSFCAEETQSYCCYNSKLARIVNEQGRPQIGKAWGSAAAPNCAGFTMGEVAMLDFSTMDLSEFVNDLAKHLPDPAKLQAGVKAKMDIMYNNAPPF